jgi:tight adherence protein B
MSAYVLVGLPIFIGVVVTMMNPTYMSPLWHSSSGHTLVITGVVMMVIGSALLKKIVSFRG